MKKISFLPVLVFGCLVASTSGGSAQLPTSSLADGLIGYYSLDGNADDGSTNGNNGIPTNLTYSTNRFGISGAAGNFSQPQYLTQSYITIPNFSTLDNFPVTYSAWFTLNNLITNPEGTLMTLIGKEAATFRHEGAVALINGASGPYTNKIAYMGYSTNYATPNENFVSTFTPNTGQWYNLVFTYNASKVATFYINGVQIDQQIYENLAPNNMEFRIGSSSSPVFDINADRPSWDGLIDDVTVYNRALNSTEVTDLYNFQAVPEPSTYALLLVSGAASLWALRRRKS
jgi:hypothetical protein